MFDELEVGVLVDVVGRLREGVEARGDAVEDGREVVLAEREQHLGGQQLELVHQLVLRRQVQVLK